jgi:uncharacterized membrane protein YkvA (DUF1232 family)
MNLLEPARSSWSERETDCLLLRISSHLPRANALVNEWFHMEAHMNKKSPQTIVPSRGGVLQEITLRTKLLFRLMADRRVNPWAKLVPIAGLIYWISPLDLISGIPGLSAVDDVAVVWFAQYMFIELCPPEVVSELSQQLASNNTIVDEAYEQDEDIVDGEATDVTGK